MIFSHEYNRLPEGLTHFFGNNDGVSASYHTAVPAVNGLSENGPHRSVGDQNTGSTRCSSSSCPFTNDCDRLIRGLLIDALLHELDPVQQDSISHASMFPGDRAALSFDCHLHQTSTRGTTESEDADEPVDSQSLSNQPPSPSSPLPPEGSILGRVLSTQLISRMDICFITPHYERVCKCLSRLGISWNEYAQMPLERRSTLPFGSPDIVESFDIVEKYLIALIARDCSIMIPLQRATQDCPAHIPTVGGNCRCLPRMVMTPVIVDLDPKPLEKFCGRFTVEKSIAEQALQRCPEFLDRLTRTHPS